MRNIDEIMNTIDNWNGTFDELVDEFTVGEYEVLFERGSNDYVDFEVIEECYRNNHADMLANFITDWLMSYVAQGYTSKATNNLFRLWSECVKE